MALCLCHFCIHTGVQLSMCVPLHVYSSLSLERFVQVGVRLSLYYALCLCEFRIHAGVRLSMCVPFHVYSSLPLEHFVQVGVRLSLYYWCMAICLCECAIELRQVGVRLSLYYALCLCEFRIHAGVRLSTCVPVHVYSSLPLERFVQVGVRLSLYYWCIAICLCERAIEQVCSCPCV